jgi:hypothetical protein
MTYSSENKVDGIVLVTEDSQEYLNPRQEVTYRQHRRELAEWMLGLAKNPGKAEGYSYSTVKNRMNRIDLQIHLEQERTLHTITYHRRRRQLDATPRTPGHERIHKKPLPESSQDIIQMETLRTQQKRRMGARDQLQRSIYDLHSTGLPDQKRPPETTGSRHGIRLSTPLQQRNP